MEFSLDNIKEINDMNSYYKGEKIIISGQLTDNNTLLTNCNLQAYLYQNGQLVDKLPFSVEGDNYTLIIDSNNYIGNVILRFVLTNDDREVIVSKNDISLYIIDGEYGISQV